MAASIDQTAPRSSIGSGTSRTVTFTNQPQVGSKVCVYVWVFNTSPAPSSVTDNAGNTYTQDKTATGNSMACFIYRSDITAVPGGATKLAVTVTFSGNRAFTAGARSYLGLAAGGPNGTNSAASSGAQTTASTGAAGGANTGLQFAVLGDAQASGTATITSGNSFTEIDAETNASSFLAGEADDRLNAQSSQGCTWTITNAASLGIIAAYDLAAGGGAVTGTGVGSFGGLGVGVGTPHVAGVGVGSFGGLGVGVGTPHVAGVAAGSFGGLGVAVGTPKASGVGVGSFGGFGTATGVRKTFGVGLGSMGGFGAGAGTPKALGQGVAAFGGLGVATGVPRVPGTAVGDFGGLGVATGSGSTAGHGTGTGVGAFGGLGTAAGTPRSLGVGVGSFGGLGVATGAAHVTGAGVGLFGGLGTAHGTGTGPEVPSTGPLRVGSVAADDPVGVVSEDRRGAVLVGGRGGSIRWP